MSPSSFFWILWLCGLALATTYYEQCVAPARGEEAGLRGELREVGVKLAQTQEKIKAIQQLEGEVAAARIEVEAMEKQVPPGSEMVWAPEQLREHFLRFGFPEPLIRFASAQSDPALSGYKRAYWSVGLRMTDPAHDLTKSLLSAAELEQAFPLFKIISFATLPDQEHPGRSLAVVSVMLLVREENRPPR